jgi:hypothetical protein
MEATNNNPRSYKVSPSTALYLDRLVELDKWLDTLSNDMEANQATEKEEEKVLLAVSELRGAIFDLITQRITENILMADCKGGKLAI